MVSTAGDGWLSLPFELNFNRCGSSCAINGNTSMTLVKS